MKNGQARATKLAHDAMNAVANDNADTGGYHAAQADYARRLIENRREGIARGIANNAAAKLAAANRRLAAQGLLI